LHPTCSLPVASFYSLFVGYYVFSLTGAVKEGTPIRLEKPTLSVMRRRNAARQPTSVTPAS
jgi:hypothetical protein